GAALAARGGRPGRRRGGVAAGGPVAVGGPGGGASARRALGRRPAGGTRAVAAITSRGRAGRGPPGTGRGGALARDEPDAARPGRRRQGRELGSGPAAGAARRDGVADQLAVAPDGAQRRRPVRPDPERRMTHEPTNDHAFARRGVVGARPG